MRIIQRISSAVTAWSTWRRVKPRRVIAAICCALACALMVWTLTPSSGDTPIVVVTKDLSPGSQLTDQDLRLAQFPARLVPDKAFKSVGEAVGAHIASGLSKGSPVTSSAVLDQQSLPEGSTDLIMPVRLTDDASAALLQPGQRIRLFSSLPEGGSEVVVEEVTIARMVEKPDGIAVEAGQLVSVILTSEDAGRIAEFAGLPISFAILPQ